MTQTQTQNHVGLRAAWEDLKRSNPSLRIRDCASQLGVSEAALLATTVGEYTTFLQGDWPSFLQRLPELGRVMSLTRNEGCVLEHKGSFQRIEIIQGRHAMATVIGPIETRVFFEAWRYGFAVRQQTPRGLQQSLQIFDEAGEAVTKIFLVEEAKGKAGSNVSAFEKIVTDFTSPEQPGELAVVKVSKAPVKSAGQVDKEALLTEWSELKDTHDFFGMLRKHQVNRKDAVSLAEGRFSHRLQKTALKAMLEAAAKDHLPIMIFAGNRGNLQIHQGKIQTVREMDHWLNILDPDFNMHLREDLIESVWVVRKPTTDGVVTGIEVFDAEKDMIVQFFGLRKPGIPERGEWAALVQTLPRYSN